MAADHVLHGIAAPDTYVHAGCAADVWCAATALTELLASPPARLDYMGGSFGGGIGALALPWDDRLSAAVLRVPSFGQHDLRLAMRCVGSGEAVRRHVAANHQRDWMSGWPRSRARAARAGQLRAGDAA